MNCCGRSVVERYPTRAQQNCDKLALEQFEEFAGIGLDWDDDLQRQMVWISLLTDDYEGAQRRILAKIDRRDRPYIKFQRVYDIAVPFKKTVKKKMMRIGFDYLSRTEQWCFVASVLAYIATMFVFVFVTFYFIEAMVESGLIIPFLLAYVSLAVVLPFIALTLRSLQLRRMHDAKKHDASF